MPVVLIGIAAVVGIGAIWLATRGSAAGGSGGGAGGSPPAPSPEEYAVREARRLRRVAEGAAEQVILVAQAAANPRSYRALWIAIQAEKQVVIRATRDLRGGCPPGQSLFISTVADLAHLENEVRRTSGIGQPTPEINPNTAPDRLWGRLAQIQATNRARTYSMSCQEEGG